MERASRLFGEEQKKRINDAVAEAESKTVAEIVPVVATASGRYDRAEDIVGLWVAVLALALIWFLVPDSGQELGSWGGTSPYAKLGCLVVTIVLGFLVGAAAASYLYPLRRLFTPKRQMRDEVEGRARQVFFDSSVHHTAGGTGLLVYVSLYERMAVVLGDERILEKLGQGEIDSMCRELTGALRGGDITAALCETVRTAGDKLGGVLPRSEGDVNELPDSLVTID